MYINRGRVSQVRKGYAKRLIGGGQTEVAGPIDWQLSVKSDFARDICEIAYKFGEPAPGAPGTLP